MPISFKTLGASATIAVLLAGCAQQQQVEPPMVTPQPIYNKFGEVVGCEGGATYDPNNEQYPCEPEECQDGQTAAAANYPCWPNRDPDDPNNSGGTPVGTGPGPVTHIP